MFALILASVLIASGKKSAHLNTWLTSLQHNHYRYCSIIYAHGDKVLFWIFTAAFGCGKPPIEPLSSRVVNGEEARSHSWPWQVCTAPFYLPFILIPSCYYTSGLKNSHSYTFHTLSLHPLPLFHLANTFIHSNLHHSRFIFHQLIHSVGVKPMIKFMLFVLLI